MKLSILSGTLTTYDKDMGDCIIYPTYGSAQMTSDVSIKDFATKPACAYRIGGFNAEGEFLAALHKTLPFAHTPNRYDTVTVTDISEDGKSFNVAWKWGYENCDRADQQIAPKTVDC